MRSFFVNYRKRYNLDSALKEYEAEHGPSGIETPPADPEDQESNSPKGTEQAANNAETNGTSTD